MCQYECAHVCSCAHRSVFVSGLVWMCTCEISLCIGMSVWSVCLCVSVCVCLGVMDACGCVSVSDGEL